MPRTRKPRSGSMQFWPKVRAKRETARIRTWHNVQPKKIGGFPVYKAGMTHVQMHDQAPNSLTKGSTVGFAVTILECPPIKVIGIRGYHTTYHGLQVAKDILAPNLDGFLSRTLSLPKKAHDVSSFSTTGMVKVSILACTQPHLINLKKTPEVLELGVGGKDAAEQFAFAKELLGKEVAIDSVFTPGEQLDIHSVNRGKGFQGPVKRYGIHLKFHKSEKGRRAPGSIAPWHGTKNWMTPHAGQMGYHLRTEYNKVLVKIGEKAQEINQAGGILKYGNVAGRYILIKGSVGGAKKRLVTLTHAARPDHRVPKKAPVLTYVSQASKQ